MNNAPYEKTIENVARRTDIRLNNDMDKARRLAEKPHCVNFCVFDYYMEALEEQVDAATADKQEQQEAKVGIEMRELNYLSTSRSPITTACWGIAS